MTQPIARRLLTAALAALILLAASAAQAQVLASWKEGPAKSAILAFVSAVTSPGPTYVSPDARVAVFDNDGTLWTEQPIYTEVAFSLQRAAEMAAGDPALAARPAFQAAVSDDPKRLAALSQAEILELVTATHSNVTVEAFGQIAHDWLRTARHPKLGRLYRDSVYGPMIELINYLRNRGFSVYIVSGGDADFMRAYAAQAYGIGPDHVIGSSNATRFERQADGRFVLMRTGALTIDDKQAKPSNIALHIGRRPIFAAGNSDGDLEMLQYATSGAGPHLGLLIHHDDAAREYAYDRQSPIGRLDKALDEAPRQGWTVVSMQRDWTTVFDAKAASEP